MRRTTRYFRTSDSPSSFEFSGADNATSDITSLNADGFAVGTDAHVNKLGVTYHYIAWNEIPGAFVVGHYAGDGEDDRDITGVGFQPEWVMVKVDYGTHAVHRPASLGDPSADTTLHFKSPKLADGHNRIQKLLPDGFQVGTHGDTNKDGKTILYMAWGRQSPPTISNITDQTTPEDVTLGPLAFTIGDVETAAGSLTVTGSSSNLALVPNANIVFGGAGASRTVTVTPMANAFGDDHDHVTVTDGISGRRRTRSC